MNTPSFPTRLHQTAAEAIGGFFAAQPAVDSVLVVNSCARGRATPESDLDFAILMQPATTADELAQLEARWQRFAADAPAIADYRQASAFAQVHLDLIRGEYAPGLMEPGGPPDYFEVELGNHIAYSAPLGRVGAHYQALRARWLPYYTADRRAERLAQTRAACEYDLAHIPSYLQRGLAFYAFDRLYVAFQKYLQALFIAQRTYPLAYNKWIREQVVELLDRPALYPRLAPIISVSDIEGDALNAKAAALRDLLAELPNT